MLPIPPEEIERFFILYLKDRYPELDLRRGTAVRDLVLAPLAELFAGLIAKIWQYEALFRGELPEDDELYERFIETLGKNLLVNRKYGMRASGRVRVYVAKRKVYKVPQGTKFYITPNLYLLATEEYTYLPEELQFNSLENAWFFEVPVVAPEPGSDYNTEAGAKVEVEPFDPYILFAETAEPITGGEDIESIEHYRQRIGKALTTRTLVSPRAIVTTLMETFDDLLVVTPIGFGDPEMWRDWKTFENVYAHVGGHADIWLKFNTPPQRLKLKPDQEGIIKYPGLLKILTPGVQVIDTDRDAAFSSESWVKVNTTEEVEVLVEPRVGKIQEFLRNSGQRVLTQDLLARVKIPATIRGEIKVAIPTPDLQAIEEKVNDWIWNYTKEDGFEVSDLIDYLYSLGAGYVSPPTLEFEIIGPDYQPRAFKVSDRFDYSEKEISTRTVGYIGEVKLVPSS
jgi:hypothetical protein